MADIAGLPGSCQTVKHQTGGGDGRVPSDTQRKDTRAGTERHAELHERLETYSVSAPGRVHSSGRTPAREGTRAGGHADTESGHADTADNPAGHGERNNYTPAAGCHAIPARPRDRRTWTQVERIRNGRNSGRLSRTKTNAGAGRVAAETRQVGTMQPPALFPSSRECRVAGHRGTAETDAAAASSRDVWA